MLKKNNYLLFIFLQFNIDYISGDISMIVSYERDYLVVPFCLFYLMAWVGYVPFFLYVFFLMLKYGVVGISIFTYKNRCSIIL